MKRKNLVYQRMWLVCVVSGRFILYKQFHCTSFLRCYITIDNLTVSMRIEISVRIVLSPAYISADSSEYYIHGRCSNSVELTTTITENDSFFLFFNLLSFGSVQQRTENYSETRLGQKMRQMRKLRTRCRCVIYEYWEENLACTFFWFL